MLLLELLKIQKTKDNSIEARISKAKEKKSETKISVSGIEIHPVHNRISLKQIKFSKNHQQAFSDGYFYWEDGEVLRKKGQLEEAIKCYDLARENGYCDALLYESYAQAYHRLQDYDNEIAILDEGIARIKKLGKKTGRLESRRENAMKQYCKNQQKEKIILDR